MLMSAELPNIENAEKETRRLLLEHQVASIFPVLLLMHEALTNAIVHGSGMNPEWHIKYVMEFSGDSIIMQVQDQGDGFPWRNFSDALPPPDMPSGRGLFIMRQYSDHLAFNDKGNSVTLTLHVQRGGDNELY